MNSEERRSRMICKDCQHTFQYGEATTVYRKLYGISIPERKCPFCGGRFRAVEIPDELDQYLFVNNDERYYSYKGRN